ncbi:2201_t:CDS:1 [Entrophospora sp. SA101]|nr:5912_t:CDS:1 [Entrophospora sp. SA101]CAJ0651390.1 2201_t:CDS:1 [Entrophospora sp. SA101]
MSHQTFLFSPKFSKKPIYDSPTNKYQEFSNAYVYSIMVKTGNGTPNRADVCRKATQEWNRIKKKSTTEIDEIIRKYLITQFNLYNIQTMRPRYPIPREDLTPLPTTIHLVEPTPEIPVNAAAQKKVANGIKIAEKKLTEFEQIYNFTTDSQLRHDMHVKIADLQAQIKSNKDKIIQLKRNAEYTQKCKEKKQKLLLESQEIILYDKPGRPPLLFQHPDLHDHIHDSVEFGSADEKRRKEVVKVRIIKNLHKNLEEKYNVYMARTTLNNYLLPHQSNSIAARAHHHPAWVAVARVSCAETRDHPNGHYCLASVKCAKQFATVFADMSVVISQDDKAKIGLGVPAVGRTFHTLQSVHEPACVADHDFPVGSGQKLVPSVYLMIKPNESNDELQTGQLAIFVRRQWSLGMSSHTHMQDLKSLTLDPQYDDVLKTNGEIRPIWVLLVDGGPDENPRHLKNIKTYCQLFRKFDLDYLTVRTHTPGQSKYNPVERGIATLSGKLAGITLPIHHYGTHLNTQGKVINPDLALQNFRYAGEALCNIWHHDLIFGKSVDVWYVEELVNPFENLQFEGTEKEKIEEQKQQKKKQEKGIDSTECFVPCSWIENHCNLCQYSIDIK